MIFVIKQARSIKEMVCRLEIALCELQGNKRVQHSEYSVAVDLQPFVNAEQTEQGTKLNLDGDRLMQEITSLVGAMQLTNIVAKNIEGVEWVVTTEEEKKTEGDVEALQTK